MPPPESSRSGVAALNALVDSSIIIVQQLNSHVKDVYKRASEICTGRKQIHVAVNPADSWDPPSSIDALALAGDAATLIRAHATKISLLIINEPFTPSAVSKVVQEMMNGSVPALSNAVQECYGDRYTYRIQRETASRCQRVLTQVQTLLESIPRDGKALRTDKGGSTSKSKATGAGPDRDAFTGIGILWNECDSVVALAKAGVRGHMIHLVKQLGETLKDELEELKEWGEEESEDEPEDADDEDDDDEPVGEAEVLGEDGLGEDQHAATQAMLDELMEVAHHIPAADPERLRPRLELTLRKIRTTSLLCTALIKRRLSVLPAMPTERPSNIAARLDNTLMVLQEIPDRFGDLASAFYDLNVSRVDTYMVQCFEDAYLAAEILVLSWEGRQDEFSSWATKFQSEVRKTLSIG